MLLEFVRQLVGKFSVRGGDQFVLVQVRNS